MISVVVPTRGSLDLEECLASLRKQKKRPAEIIAVSDRQHASRTGAIARRYGARIILDNHGTIGGAYATGAAEAKGSIVAFIDDDCIAPPDWTAKIEKEFEHDIDVVSGEDPLPPKASFFQKAAYQIDKARMMTKPAYGAKAKSRLRAANIAYRKRVFEKESFNPRLKGLQEPEFHHRLFKAGFRMKFDPSLRVYHKRRDSLPGIFSQIYRNGKAKIKLLRMHPDMLSKYELLVFAYISLFLISIAFMLQGNSFYLQSVLAGTFLYFAAKPFRYILFTKEILYYPYLFAIILTREAAYFLGLIAGIKNIFLSD